MSTYLYAMRMAFLFFPLLAILVTLPYIISQYRKYGSILVLRSVIIYSFILYLLVIYFLVILPLPPISEVQNYTSPFIQLEPFYSVIYLKNNIHFNIFDFDTYWNLFGNSYFYQIIYNIFITIPFGIYLRYYFKCDLKKTFFYSFLLSLFFELTQLSGLYGIYPRPYRIFDVDDLITNTLGGLLGYLITPIICCVLPSREKLDKKAYLKGKNVGSLRRGIAFLIDIIVLNICLFITHYLTKNLVFFNHLYVQIFFLITFYFVFIPIFVKGKTIGRLIVNIKVVDISGSTPKWYQYFMREYLFWGIVIFGIPILIYCYKLCTNLYLKMLIISFIFLILILLLGYFFKIFLKFKKNKRYFYETFSKTKYISTIQKIEKEEIVSEKEEEEIKPE